MYSATDVQYYSKLWTHMQFPNAKANYFNEKPGRFFLFQPENLKIKIVIIIIFFVMLEM